MASRDNQTLQIFVIALALGVILFGGLAIWLNGVKNTAVASAKDAKQKAQQASSSEREVQGQANSYKQWMGFQEADTFETLRKSIAGTKKEDGEDGDLVRFGSTFDEQSRTYRNILINIFDENLKLAQSEAAAKQQVKDLKQRLLATEKEKDGQIAEYKKTTEQAQADKASEHNLFEEQRGEMNAKQEELAKKLASQRTRIDELLATHADDKKTLSRTISDLKRVIEILQNTQAIPDPYAQPADGLISYVDQRENKVWINLGSADHLRPQVTFSVYSGDVNDVNAAQSKGSIEITRILDDHMAEARITSDQTTRPLMEGDKVYSQVWNRGRQVGFAITGVIDIDGDGRSDLEQLQQIVVLNNGKVDAVPGKDGTIDGEMTASTRYLILGEHPGASDDARAARRAWESMSTEADTLNVEAITLGEFLSLMGWQAEHKAVKLGAGARANDFPARPVSDYTPRETTSQGDRFRRRKPQPAY